MGAWYYRVAAVDGAGNVSAPSAAAEAVIGGDAVQVVLRSPADSWVDSAQPDQNHGGDWAISADADPMQAAHLKFDLPAAPPGRHLGLQQR